MAVRTRVSLVTHPPLPERRRASLGDISDFLRDVVDLGEGDVDPKARLVLDLGLDSLAVAELVLFLANEGGYSDIDDIVEVTDWANVSLEQLLAAAGRAAG